MARAKHALEAAQLESNVPLTRASSVTNEVWLTPDFAIRVNRRPDHRLRREAQLGPLLPAEVHYPEVVAYGEGTGFDWLIVRRVPGNVLSRSWPTMPPAQRRLAVRQIAFMLRTLHGARSPIGLDDMGAPQLLQSGQGKEPTAPLLAGLQQARELKHVDAKLIGALTEIVRQTSRFLEPFDGSTLIHGDLTFENVLWDGEQRDARCSTSSGPAPPPPTSTSTCSCASARIP